MDAVTIVLLRSDLPPASWHLTRQVLEHLGDGKEGVRDEVRGSDIALVGPSLVRWTLLIDESSPRCARTAGPPTPIWGGRSVCRRRPCTSAWASSNPPA